jgi:hypothetical protein
MDTHISCQVRSKSSMFQSRANSKMRRYIGMRLVGGYFPSPASPFTARAGACQNCANVYSWKSQKEEPTDTWRDARSVLRSETSFRQRSAFERPCLRIAAPECLSQSPSLVGLPDICPTAFDDKSTCTVRAFTRHVPVGWSEAPKSIDHNLKRAFRKLAY